MKSRTFEEMVAAVQAFHTKHKFKGTPNENLRYRIALHVEELGEFSAAITKGLGKDAVAEELSDNLILLLGDAISADLDLEKAFFAKMARIMQRPAKRVGDTIRVTETGQRRGPPAESQLLHLGATTAELAHQVRLEKKKTLEAFQSNVRIFQLTEKVRSAYNGTVELAKARSVDELMRETARLLCDPKGMDLKGSAVYLDQGGRLTRTASSPSRRPGRVPPRVARLLRQAARRGPVGKRLVLPIRGETRALGLLEVRFHALDSVRTWQTDILRTFVAYVGLLAEHLEEASDPDRTELRQLQARHERLICDLAKPSQGKQDLLRLQDLKAETEARIRHLEKRLRERA